MVTNCKVGGVLHRVYKSLQSIHLAPLPLYCCNHHCLFQCIYTMWCCRTPPVFFDFWMDPFSCQLVLSLTGLNKCLPTLLVSKAEGKRVSRISEPPLYQHRTKTREKTEIQSFHKSVKVTTLCRWCQRLKRRASCLLQLHCLPFAGKTAPPVSAT